MKKWKRLSPSQFSWTKPLLRIWFFCLIILAVLCVMLKGRKFLFGMAATLVIGVVCIAAIHLKTGRIRKISNLMENFIRNNSLYQSHDVVKGFFRPREVECMDYYPIVEYKEVMGDNIFCVRIRMDGCLRSEKFRDMEQPLADMFHTVCTDRIEERGYLTYCFELQKQEQIRIKSNKDIPKIEGNTITFSQDIVWNWKKCPHILITGNTGQGKTQLAQYVIFCLVKQGRVIYCDPKGDFEMRQFAVGCNAVYVSEEREIAKAVREIEEEMRKRGKELENIGIKEADFPPLFLIFDEMIAFSKIAEKKTYEETIKRIASIVVMGRSKCVYAGLILQRPDTSFIEGAIRDNLGCRICMGQMSDTAYKMAFGSDFADVKNLRREIGSGLIYRQGVDTKPREFLAPYLEKGALSRE